MTDRQKAKLFQEIQTLIKETEGYEDARQYLQDVVDDVGCTQQEALDELKRQCGKT